MASSTAHEEEILGRIYDRRLTGRLLAYVRPARGLVAGALACLVLESLTQLAGPLLTRRVIDVAFPAGDEALVVQSALLFAASLVVQFGAAYGETMLTALLGQRVMRDLRHDLFAHLQRLPIPFFDRNPVGRLMTRVTSDVEALNELFTAGVVAGLGGPLHARRDRRAHAGRRLAAGPCSFCRHSVRAPHLGPLPAEGARCLP